jgi:hypothetical protein
MVGSNPLMSLSRTSFFSLIQLLNEPLQVWVQGKPP